MRKHDARRSQAGVTLVQLLIGVAIGAGVSLAVVALRQIMENDVQNAQFILRVETVRDQIRKTLKDTDSRAIGKEDLAQLYSGWIATIKNNASMKCLWDIWNGQDASCPKSPAQNTFALYHSNGELFYDATLPTSGFTLQGTPCNGFITPAGSTFNGNDQCPLRFDLGWRTECPGGGDCKCPTTVVRAEAVYNPSASMAGAQKRAVNVNKRGFLEQRIPTQVRVKPIVWVEAVKGATAGTPPSIGFPPEWNRNGEWTPANVLPTSFEMPDSALVDYSNSINDPHPSVAEFKFHREGNLCNQINIAYTYDSATNAILPSEPKPQFSTVGGFIPNLETESNYGKGNLRVIPALPDSVDPTKWYSDVSYNKPQLTPPGQQDPNAPRPIDAGQSAPADVDASVALLLLPSPDYELSTDVSKPKTATIYIRDRENDAPVFRDTLPWQAVGAPSPFLEVTGADPTVMIPIPNIHDDRRPKWGHTASTGGDQGGTVMYVWKITPIAAGPITPASATISVAGYTPPAVDVDGGKTYFSHADPCDLRPSSSCTAHLNLTFSTSTATNPQEFIVEPAIVDGYSAAATARSNIDTLNASLPGAKKTTAASFRVRVSPNTPPTITGINAPNCWVKSAASSDPKTCSLSYTVDDNPKVPASGTFTSRVDFSGACSGTSTPGGFVPQTVNASTSNPTSGGICNFTINAWDGSGLAADPPQSGSFTVTVNKVPTVTSNPMNAVCVVQNTDATILVRVLDTDGPSTVIKLDWSDNSGGKINYTPAGGTQTLPRSNATDFTIKIHPTALGNFGITFTAFDGLEDSTLGLGVNSQVVCP